MSRGKGMQDNWSSTSEKKKWVLKRTWSTHFRQRKHGDNLPFRDHEQIFLVPYHRTLLIYIPYAIFKHATHYKGLYANDDEPFKEGPNLRRNWSVCMCVSECVRMQQMEEALTSIVFWNLIKDVKKDVITCKELVQKLAKNVLKLWWLFFVKRRIF